MTHSSATSLDNTEWSSKNNSAVFSLISKSDTNQHIYIHICKKNILKNQ